MTESSITTGALAWLLTYAVHSTVLLGGAWFLATRRSVRSERVREAIWKTAVVGGVITASVQLGFGFEPFGGRFSLEPSPVRIAAKDSVRPVAHTQIEPPAQAELWAESVRKPLEPRTLEPEHAFDEEPQVGAAALALGSPRTAWAVWANWANWAIGAWLVGGGVLLVLLLGALVRLRARLAGRRRIEDGPLPGLLALLRRRAGVTRGVRLFVSPRLEAPIAMGTLFPKVCVPPRALADLSLEMQEAMLAHELAHIARFDPLWLGICRFFETVFFFQPLNRVARKRLQASAELLCDDMAVAFTENRIGLARCLARVASWILGDRRALPVCGMADLSSPLGERVERILDTRAKKERRPGWTAPAGAALLVATTLVVPGFSSAAGIEDVARGDSVPDLEAAPVTAPAPAFAPSTAAANQGLGAPFAEFQRDLDVLDEELAGLRAEAEEKGVPAHLREKLAGIEDRVRSARERNERIQKLLTEVALRRSGTPENSSESGDTRGNR